MPSSILSDSARALLGNPHTFGDLLGGVHGKRQSRGSVGVAVLGSGCDEFDQALWGDDPLDTSQIVTQLGVVRNAHRLTLEGFLGAAEQFALAIVGEVDGVELVVP